jgi:hypothetical protein
MKVDVDKNSLTQIGECVYELGLNRQSREKIYKDLEGNFFLELANSSIIEYPSAIRIQDFVSAWDRAYYIDTTDGRHHYVVYPYDAVTLDIWGNSIAELLELIRQFVTPSIEINRALELSAECHKYYENTANADFGRK